MARILHEEELDILQEALVTHAAWPTPSRAWAEMAIAATTLVSGTPSERIQHALAPVLNGLSHDDIAIRAILGLVRGYHPEILKAVTANEMSDLLSPDGERLRVLLSRDIMSADMRGLLGEEAPKLEPSEDFPDPSDMRVAIKDVMEMILDRITPPSELVELDFLRGYRTLRHLILSDLYLRSTGPFRDAAVSADEEAALTLLEHTTSNPDFDRFLKNACLRSRDLDGAMNRIRDQVSRGAGHASWRRKAKDNAYIENRLRQIKQATGQSRQA